MYSFLDLTTPTNIEAERAKFLSSNSYHPTFHYLWSDETVKYHSVIPLKQQLIEAIISQDHARIIQLAQDFFQTEITPTTAELARAVVKRRTSASHSGTADEFAAILRSAFADFQIPYQVVLTDQGGFNARPLHSQRQLQISRHIHYEMFSLEGGIRHDLVHIMRHLNTQFNQIPRSPNYLPLEEGLASYCQDHVLGVTDNGEVQHAAEYLGTEIGLQGSLRDIYDFMRSIGMSAELAWKRASRHKFGFINTQQPGDLIKPAMYFAHEVVVSGLSTDERLRLFVGKISLADLPEHPAYSGLWPATQLVAYFNL